MKELYKNGSESNFDHSFMFVLNSQRDLEDFFLNVFELVPPLHRELNLFPHLFGHQDVGRFFSLHNVH